MSKITVQRTDRAMPQGVSLDYVRELLFGIFDGFGDNSRKAWRGLWRRLINFEPGEMVQVEFIVPRNPKFHRKFFALLQVGYDAWEPGRKHKTHKGMPVAKNFEQFREDITILAGFYEQTFDLQGRMTLRAKSISFANMEDPEFEQLYSAVADVLLQHILTKYAGREELDNVVNQVLGFL